MHGKDRTPPWATFAPEHSTRDWTSARRRRRRFTSHEVRLGVAAAVEMDTLAERRDRRREHADQYSGPIRRVMSDSSLLRVTEQPRHWIRSTNRAATGCWQEYPTIARQELYGPKKDYELHTARCVIVGGALLCKKSVLRFEDQKVLDGDAI
jgi:hypothetical protein